MKSRPSAALWMGSAFGAAACMAAITLGIMGAGEKGTDAALLVTARLSFLLFWPAYAGSAMVALFGATFQPLKQRAREFGLAFASAHLVHIGLVAWLCVIGAAPSLQTFIFFGIALLWIYLLALFSNARLNHALGPRLWWLLRTIGLNFIAYAFFVDFIRHPFDFSIKHAVEYSPFAVLAVAGPALRLAAFTLRLGHVWRNWSYRAG